jgi:hypothetical protein
MIPKNRWTLAAVASGLELVVACGGRTAEDDAGSPADVSSACDDYFQATLTLACIGRDEGSGYPTSEAARVRSRADTLCAESAALPGSGRTPSVLEACVSALESGGCAGFAVCGENGANGLFGTGSLGSGASCVRNFQCASGNCPAGNDAPDGGFLRCGTCAPLPAVGQECAHPNTMAVLAKCTEGATCNYAATPPTCVAVTLVGSGGACTAPGAECAAGLSCDPGGTCVPTVDVPPSCSRCVPLTWASAGQPCDETFNCLVGECAFDGSTSAGVCPSVIPDGQPCSTGDPAFTCDAYASCQDGMCVIGYPSCP